MYLLICAVFTFFGVIHSAIPDGNMYLPWQLSFPAFQVPYLFSTGYVILALMFFALSHSKGAQEPYPEHI
jgi:hypothetical protein